MYKNVLISVVYKVMICRVRVFIYERWALDKILPRVLIQVDQWRAVWYGKHALLVIHIKYTRKIIR